MKIIAAVSMLGVLLAIGVNTTSGSTISTISITATQHSSRSSGVSLVRYYLLYNRRIGPSPIGNAVIICRDVGMKNGPVRRIAKYCQGTYAIAHDGSIQVEGLNRAPYVYEQAVTGGTGRYFNAGGQLKVTVFSISPRREILSFRLETP